MTITITVNLELGSVCFPEQKFIAGQKLKVPNIELTRIGKSKEGIDYFMRSDDPKDFFLMGMYVSAIYASLDNANKKKRKRP